MEITIESMTENDWNDVSNIYLQGILTKNSTFEKDTPDWKYWDQNHRSDCRLIAKQNGITIGWAALSNISGRCVYSGVAEVSIYIDSSFRGKGVGQKLME